MKNHNRWKIFFLSFMSIFWTAGCFKMNPPQVREMLNPSSSSLSEQISSDSVPSLPPDSIEDDQHSPSLPPTSGGELNICSRLNFKGVQWPHLLSWHQHNAFGLALNITGSFEGMLGWNNITDNFDGQGMSLGLLQQNLGQGSLQPLLLNMRVKHLDVLEQKFSPLQLRSLLDMLINWEKSVTPFASSSLWDREMSSLDMDPCAESDSSVSSCNESNKVLELFAFLVPRNTNSVKWATQNIYTRTGSFKSDWKKAFQNLAISAEYVSEQMEAAIHLHERTSSYMRDLSFRELRSYLFFFDIVVQNGGIPATVREEYKKWSQTRSSISEAKKLEYLLNLRLRQVRKEYRDDVLRRKTTIILGSGKVHGQTRSLSKEFCYNPAEILAIDSSHP